jgi:TctA family transporter
MSSSISYYLEKRLRTKQGSYQTDGDMHTLVSAETANNVAILVALIPLFLFALPVGPAEAMILNLIERSGVFISAGSLAADQYFYPTIFAFLLSGVVGLMFAWFGAQHVMKKYKLPSNLLKSVLICALLLSVAYGGLESHSVGAYLVMLGVFTAIGMALRNYQTEIILFSFLIFPMLEGSAIRFFMIYF